MVEGGVNGNPALISTGFTPVRPIFDGERKGRLSLFQRKYSNKRNEARFSVSSENFSAIFCSVAPLSCKCWQLLTKFNGQFSQKVQALGFYEYYNRI
jgi:hypothetical protein